jgi:hypothetical protein
MMGTFSTWRFIFVCKKHPGVTGVYRQTLARTGFQVLRLRTPGFRIPIHDYGI